MVNLAKRVAALERAAGVGRYDDGLCRCGPAGHGPILFDVRFDGQEPEPAPAEICSGCGREKERVTFHVVYDDPPDKGQLSTDLIQPEKL